MSTKRTGPLISIAVVLLAATALFFAVSSSTLDALGEIRIGNVGWSALALLAATQIAFLWLAAEVWRRAVRVMTGVNVGLVSAYMQLAAVAVGKYVPGKVLGFIVRAGEMHRQDIPVRMAVMSSVVEQMLVLGGALLVAIGAAVIALPQYRGTILLLGFLILAGVVLLSVKVPEVTNWILRKRMPGAEPVRMAGYHPISVLRFVLGYALIWLLSGAMFSTIYFALFDVSVSVALVAALILGNTLGIAIGFFAFFAPGGIGVREAIAAAVLAPFLPVREALMAAVAYRGWMVIVDGINAVIMLAREAGRSKSHSISAINPEK